MEIFAICLNLQADINQGRNIQSPDTSKVIIPGQNEMYQFMAKHRSIMPCVNLWLQSANHRPWQPTKGRSRLLATRWHTPATRTACGQSLWPTITSSISPLTTSPSVEMRITIVQGPTFVCTTETAWIQAPWLRREKYFKYFSRRAQKLKYLLLITENSEERKVLFLKKHGVDRNIIIVLYSIIVDQNIIILEFLRCVSREHCPMQGESTLSLALGWCLLTIMFWWSPMSYSGSNRTRVWRRQVTK